GLLREYAKAGDAVAVRAVLADTSWTTVGTLTRALLAAGEALRAARAKDRPRYVATLETLLAAGADASVLPLDLADALPTLQARAFDADFPAPLAPCRTGSRL